MAKVSIGRHSHYYNYGNGVRVLRKITEVFTNKEEFFAFVATLSETDIRDLECISASAGYNTGFLDGYIYGGAALIAAGVLIKYGWPLLNKLIKKG